MTRYFGKNLNKKMRISNVHIISILRSLKERGSLSDVLLKDYHRRMAILCNYY